MKWGNKPYYSLDFYLRQKFGQKVFKISLDGGFTCPNRDGTISEKGCIFCSERGSGDFTPPSHLSITEQFIKGRKLLEKKWPSGKYIAYFQAFTNTYAPIKELRKKYEEALSIPGVVGIAIATRPDCLDNSVLDLLEEINKKTYLWVELGLQSIHETTASLINRGYSLSCFEDAVNNLFKRKIEVVVHLILGLPGENKNDMLDSIKYINNMPIQGIKLHLLHVLKNTPLHSIYKKNPFHILEMKEYVNLVIDCLEILSPSIVIHRITGDGSKNILVAPTWSKNKRAVLNEIHKTFKLRNTWQGKFFSISCTK
ncbi:TIGR01212 family radical SAM protein [Defluviitalea phaphyphila]|uniref:TIGR01212 family radical SAM protein n=1 Tax=Defluviitalea phaphyphila TaxID=1473580 RepID=UPI0007313B79|nr:TIGR01212 family radical SAM protein [Defluviitalea phaphyphila]